jgi:hypothetical protein
MSPSAKLLNYARARDRSYRPDARFRDCLIVLMLAFGIAACIVAVSLILLMATVALTVAAIRQSVRVIVKALDASITWIDTRTDRALLRLRA